MNKRRRRCRLRSMLRFRRCASTRAARTPIQPARTVSLGMNSGEVFCCCSLTVRKTNEQIGVDDLDHEVLAVGYGTDQQGVNYWIVKNSWSTWWGNQGYFNLKIDGNVCGAATAATQPIV